MATGVRQSPPGAPAGRGARGRGNPLKDGKRKWLLIGGAGLGGLLLLGHGRSQGSGTSSSDLQNQADALAAEQAAMSAGPLPGGYGAINSGGADIVAKKAPAVVINVRTGGSSAGGNVGGTGGKTKGPQRVPKYRHDKPSRASQALAGVDALRDRKYRHDNPDIAKKIHPKQGHRGKPAPAGKGGLHPDTPHKTPGGAHKSSPAVVESVNGNGAGVVALGREFPGAVSHTISGPGRNGGRVVTVNYGGRTDKHLVLPDGAWVDHAAGMNPPTRGVPMRNMRGVPL